jgi:hypothetical protein
VRGAQKVCAVPRYGADNLTILAQPSLQPTVFPPAFTFFPLYIIEEGRAGPDASG